MSAVRPTARFYAVNASFNAPGSGGLARNGPFDRVETVALQNNLSSLPSRGPLLGPWGYDGQLRMLRYPGVLRVEQPARGEIVTLPTAGITNNNTITLDDGGGNVGVFRLRKSGANPGTDIDVNLTAATTADEVATILAAAIETWTSGLGNPPDGFQASVTTNHIGLVQAGSAKNDSSSRSWFGITHGQFGNVAIVAQAGTSLSVAGMAGGKPRVPGIPAWFAPHHRVITTPGYAGPIKANP
jgi:hypothetical protein